MTDQVEQQEATSSTSSQGSVFLFIEEVRNLFSSDEIKDKMRITPRGLFLAEELLSSTIEKYQLWLQKKTEGAVAKSARKCTKRLFGSEDPQQYYLVEGKECLLGHLIPCEIQQPQNFRLPYYLGSLLDTSDYLHLKDPLFRSLSKVEAVSTTKGLEVKVSVGRRSYRIAPGVLKEFSVLAQNSYRLSKSYPEVHKSLRASLRVLIKLIKKARYVRPNHQLLIPVRYQGKKAAFLRSGALILAADGDENISCCYELQGKNYYHFVRIEFGELYAKMRPRRMGAFEIFSRKDKYLGAFGVQGRKFLLHLQAFKDFLDRVPHSYALRDSFSGHYSVLDCLQTFTEFFEKSELIDARKIVRHLENPKDRSLSYRTFERWIFIISRGDIVSGCIDKSAKRTDERPRAPRRR